MHWFTVVYCTVNQCIDVFFKYMQFCDTPPEDGFIEKPKHM
jgi:hypothetical protein